uniref:Profilin n=1 Tax=Gasterosteus aculeatus aculeatus TaxID=481459 RepID=G3N821_GASAC
MSWDAYRDQLTAVESVTEAGIFGLDGSTWSSTPGLTGVTAPQIKILAGSSADMNINGPKIANMKCMLLRDERQDTQSFCMHLKTSASDGKLAVCVGQSNKGTETKGGDSSLCGPVQPR